jgi:hypothetical protein
VVTQGQGVYSEEHHLDHHHESRGNNRHRSHRNWVGKQVVTHQIRADGVDSGPWIWAEWI